MPELPGQRISGTPMSEREIYARALENIHGLRDCYRGLALMRGDERWLVPARLMEELEDRTKKLMVAGQRPFLIMPRRM